MNWYRVTFSNIGKRLPPVDLPAHNTTDAVYCAAVKAGLNNSEAGDVELVDIECINDPEQAKALLRLKQTAMRGVAQLTERLESVAGEKKPKPAGDA